MSPKEYMKLALGTDLKTREYNSLVKERISHKTTARLIHASLGMTTESAEIADALKKHLMYGKPLDQTNLIEEVGDVLWYAAVLLDELGVSFEDAMEANIRKLKRRYPEGFTADRALNRDLKSEREALEKTNETK